MNQIKEPIDLIRFNIGEKIIVKCRHDRELRGKLHVKKFLIKSSLNN